MHDSDDAAAKMVAVVVAGLLTVSGVGYFAYTLGTDDTGPEQDGAATASTGAGDSGTDASASDAGSDGSAGGIVADDQTDGDVDQIDGGGGDSGDDEDDGCTSDCHYSEGGCEPDCDDNDGSDDVGVPFTLEPLGLYLGATNDDCEQDLLLDTDIGATVVESCKKYTSGNTVNMIFQSNADGMPYLDDPVFDGEIYLKINYFPGVTKALKVHTGMTCDGVSWTFAQTSFDYDGLPIMANGYRQVAFHQVADHDTSVHGERSEACAPFTKVSTNVAASSIQFRFDPDVPSFTDLSLQEDS